MKQYYILAKREDGSVFGFKTDLPIRQFTKLNKLKSLNLAYCKSTKNFITSHDICMNVDVLESEIPITYGIIKQL